ncbi:hypothetical protein GCM10028815_19660 [Mariniluteicoccus flavus]
MLDRHGVLHQVGAGSDLASDDAAAQQFSQLIAQGDGSQASSHMTDTSTGDNGIRVANLLRTSLLAVYAVVNR